MRVLCSVEVGDELHDVLVDAGPDATVGELRRALSQLLRHDAAEGAVGVSGRNEGALWLHDRLLDDDAPLASSELTFGAVLAFGAAALHLPLSVSDRGWQLHVVSGPDSGAVFVLPIGRHVLGRSEGIALRDPSVSRKHAAIDVTSTGATVLDLGSANGTLLDGEAVPSAETGGSGTPVRAGQLIHVGDSLLVIRAADRALAAVKIHDDGTVELTRAPRIRPPAPAARVVMPAEPAATPTRRIPVTAMVAPAILGVVMALVLAQPMYLVFALGSPVMAVANDISQRRQGARDARQAQENYRERFSKARDALATARRAEIDDRREAHPDAATLLLAAMGPRARLWERRPSDEDFLDLRIGSAHLPAELEVVGGDREVTRPTLPNVPATVGLSSTGVIGFAGTADDLAGILRWQLLQLATLHSHRDVRLVYIAQSGGVTHEWLRWLPHVQGATSAESLCSIGNDADTTAARVAELNQVLETRRSLVSSTGAAGVVLPVYVVILDGARALRGLPGVKTLLTEGPALGVFVLCLDTEARLLPQECRATVTPDPDEPQHATVSTAGERPIRHVLVDQVSATATNSAARALAPLRDRGVEAGTAQLPDSASLLDLVGMPDPEATSIRAGWALAGRSTSFPIGVGVGGPFKLDLVSDGPHALLAGTTGSGKSELLQSIVASLALANRPDAMNFVLVDYKGGSAFKDCVRLPHTVGMVTDLDEHLVRRALASLQAELTYREHRLASVAAKNIEDYTELQERDGGEPLPRLVLVIDEFASMVRELPDFMPGLVNIAQRGRSLGIHLILATQRPSGSVSPEIKANTNLRVSLRVLDAADSSDVIDAPDAARLPKSTPGRALVRLGHGALASFQAGRVGGRRAGSVAVDAEPPFVSSIGWLQLGYRAPEPQHPEAKTAADVTDLSALVVAVTEASLADGVAEQRRPWLDALPEIVVLDDPRLTSASRPGGLPAVPIGLRDVPARQAQEAASFDLELQSHQYVVGGQRSGRSQYLRTLAGSAARLIGASDLHIYGIDCGTGALLPMTALPHCGAIVGKLETERAQRLLDRLSAEVDRRQHVLATGNLADLNEQRVVAAPEHRLPHIMLLIDRWEAFSTTIGAADNGKMVEQVMALLREGASVGLHVVITGDRMLVSSRMGALVEHKLALRLPDRNDYQLVGVPTRRVPEVVAAGRGFEGEDATELQIALLTADPDGAAQAAELARLSAVARERDGESGPRPFMLASLPTRIGYAEALSAPCPVPSSVDGAFVAVGGDDVSPIYFDMAERASTLLIAGPPKSGRTNALLVLAASLLATGVELVVGAPRSSGLTAIADVPGVRAVLVAAGRDEWAESLQRSDGDRPLVVLLDDAEGLRDSPAKDLLVELARGGRGPGWGLVAAGNSDGLATGLSGWHVDMQRNRQGLLLSPQTPNDGDLIGVKLPRSVVGIPTLAGRGWLHLGDGQPQLVQVPIASVDWSSKPSLVET